MAVSTQPLISVIVPVYNVERYLDQCVESLIGQTYERLEIILVDDGSTDSSGEQCNAWANRDNRIRAVRQCNAGLAAARNTGLDLAKGEYIGFVDSDDYVLPDMFGTLLHNLQESDADLSIISYERENPDGSTYCNAFPDKKIVMTSQEAFAYVNQHGYFYVTAWDKLAKKELFDNLPARRRLCGRFAGHLPAARQGGSHRIRFHAAVPLQNVGKQSVAWHHRQIRTIHRSHARLGANQISAC